MNFLKLRFTVDKIELIDPMAASRNILFADKPVFTSKYPSQSARDSFLDKVNIISEDLEINPDWLMLVMYKESGFSPSIVNASAGATGLIQFMPSTATSLGTTTASLKAMSGLQQLDYVKKYYAQILKWFPKTSYNSFYDLYLATFYPAAVGQSDSFVLGLEKGNESYAKKIFDQNPAISKFAAKNHNNSHITIKDFKDYTDAAMKEAGIEKSAATKYDLYMKFIKNKNFAIAVLAVIPIVVGGFLLYREGAFDGLLGKAKLAVA